MTVSARKITAFAKLVAGLADTPNLGGTTALKQWFDSSPEELRVAINGLIDDLIATAAGASGTEQIGSAPISGVAGATAYAQLVDLKNQLTSAVMGALTTDTKSALTQKIGIINGNFDIWQRGSSFSYTTVGNRYTADRWYHSLGAIATGSVAINQNSNVVPIGSKYAVELAYNTSTGVGDSLTQLYETVDVLKLRGLKVTLSFQAKVSVGALSTNARIIDGTDVDAFPATLPTTDTVAVNLTTTYQKFTLTHLVQAGANSLAVRLFDTNKTGFGNIIYLSQVQLNIGDIALPFQPKSFANELLDCQRYYESSYNYGKLPPSDTLDNANGSIAIATANNQAVGNIPFKVSKRISNSTVTIYNYNGTAGKVSTPFAGDVIGVSVTATRTGNRGFTGVQDSGTSFTAGNNYWFGWTSDAEI